MTDTTHEALAEAQARRLETTAEQLAELLSRPEAAERLRVTEGENEWSAMEVLGHVVEMIPYWGYQCKRLIEAAEPPPFGRTLDAPERLAGPARGAAGDIGELVGVLRVEVGTAAEAIRGMSAAEFARKGIHGRRGEMTVADIVEIFVVGHVEEHLAQARSALAE